MLMGDPQALFEVEYRNTTKFRNRNVRHAKNKQKSICLVMVS